MKYRKWLLSLALVCLVVALFGAPDALAATTDDGWDYEITDSGVTITCYTGTETELTIPAEIDGYPVTEIGKRAFQDCASLTSVTIPDSVTAIGERAFWDCTGLTSVTIGSGVTSIGESTFLGCSSLTSVTIGSGVTSIGESAFNSCWEIKKVYTPSLEAWCGIEFDDWDSTPACYGADLYINNTLVTELVLPDSMTSIGNYTFAGCQRLTSVTIPDSMTSIGNYTFAGCQRLTSVTIPDSVTSIGAYTFCDCSRLTSITVPASVTSIGEFAFGGCWSIEKVYTPSLAAWCGIDFCGSYSSPACNGADLYINNTPVTELVLPDSMTSIGNYTFAGCTSLTSITIPDSVTSIGEQAFASCSSLTSIVVAEGNPVYHSSGNCMIETASKTLIVGCSASVIPDDGSVTSLGDYAFANCWNQTSVTIPDGVTAIGDYTFYCCACLTSITLPDSVTEIGSSAFSYCLDLASIAIPDSVTEIEERAFYGCDSLSTVYYNGTAEGWAEITINNEYGENDSLLTAERHYVAFIDLIDEAGAAKLAFCEWGQTLSMDEIEALYAHHVTLYTDAAHTTEFDLTTAVNENLTLYVALGEPFYYSVTVADTENGTVTVSPTRAAAGETVSFTVTANDGFTYVLWVETESGKPLDFTDTYDDNVVIFTFTMPAENVEIHAEFVSDGDDDDTYYVTYVVTGNGTLEVSTLHAAAGETVYFAVAAYDGFVLDEVVVLNESDVPLDLTTYDDNVFSFTMPAEDVEIRAVFVSDGDDSDIGGGDDDADCPSRAFTDLASALDENPTAWWLEATNYVIDNGLMKGVGDNQFQPNGTTTRAMLVTILYRLDGSPAVSGACTFSDVPADMWYTDAVIWASENGIVNGLGDGTFGADDVATREQIAVIFYRFAQHQNMDVSATTEQDSYPDGGDVSVWALDAMKWANASGLMIGRADDQGNTVLAPDGQITRSEMAMLLYRWCTEFAK